MSVQDVLLFIVKLLAGTGVFLVGVRLLTANVEQLATSKIKTLFSKTADKKMVNVGIGAATTALIQSSGVTTVLIVGFVNVGVMNLYQATAMIMGANIGTTITAQIAALSAFPITTYIQGFVFVGVMMAMLCKNENRKKTGMIIAGLGLVFIGLAVMSDSMSGNKDAIQKIFAVVKNPFLLFFIGIFLTALVQSSSATTSIIIAMSVAGLTIGTGGNEVLYIILGTNIGSCVTALMSSLGGSANAKRTGLIHLMFNTFGSVIFFVILICWPSFMSVTFQKWFPEMATQIAMFHTFFNVLCTLMFLPFSKLFVKAAEFLVKDKKKEKETTYLDERMISSPMLAIAQVEKEIMRLSDRAMGAFRDAFRAFLTKDVSKISSIQKVLESMSGYNQEIINFIIKLSANCPIQEEKRVSDLHNNLGDILRIAEIADNLNKYTRRSEEKNLIFSDEVKEQLTLMVEKIEELYELTKRTVLEKDRKALPQVERAEEEIDTFRKNLIDNHIDRLNRGDCKPESSSVFINLVSNLERLGDHLTYVAYTLSPVEKERKRRLSTGRKNSGNGKKKNTDTARLGREKKKKGNVQ